MRIGELAERSGRSVSAIRYYEAEGLLEPADRISGRRDFDEEALERLGFISAGQRAGLSLPEIRDLLNAGGEGSVALAALAARRLRTTEADLETLQARRRWLALAKACRCPDLRECRLFTDPSCALPA